MLWQGTTASQPWGFVTSLGAGSHSQVIQHCNARSEKSDLEHIVEYGTFFSVTLNKENDVYKKFLFQLSFVKLSDLCLRPQALSQRDAPHRNFFFFDGLKGSGVVDYFGPKWTQSSSSSFLFSSCFFLPSSLVFVTIHKILFRILNFVSGIFFVCFLIKQHSLKVWVFKWTVSVFGTWTNMAAKHQ